MKKRPQDMVLLSGDEALARGAWEAGVRVSCAYPGTPSTEITETLNTYREVDAQWSVNEKVAYEVALAASIAGARSIFAAKHVGINVAMDPLMTSAYTGVGAGFVVVTCDDPGLHSSQNEQDNRLLAEAAHLPLLEPSSPFEAYVFAKKAFELSERFDIPFMIRLTTRIAHTKENMVVGSRKEAPLKPFEINPQKYVMVPKNAMARHAVLQNTLSKLGRFSDSSMYNKIEAANSKLGIVCAGPAYLYAKEMYPDASFLKIGMPYPFPEKKALAFASMVKELVVAEELEPFMENKLKMLGIKARGKHPSFCVGELRPEHLPLIVKGLKKPVAVEPPARKPVMCPGCPHRPVFWALKKMKATVAGDIGCYTLGALQPLSALHTCVCMGSGVTFFEGLKKGSAQGVVGVIGDSTFVHSGITGLINAVYNKAQGLVLILDNGTTAMTGSQPHPATGVTIKGESSKKLSLEDLCRVCGADYVEVASPDDIKALEGIIRKRAAGNGLSVVVVRSLCKLIDRSRSDVPHYDEQACKRCGLCLQLDCPALSKKADGTIALDAALCTGCGLCAQVCPFMALYMEDGHKK